MSRQRRRMRWSRTAAAPSPRGTRRRPRAVALRVARRRHRVQAVLGPAGRVRPGDRQSSRRDRPQRRRTRRDRSIPRSPGPPCGHEPRSRAHRLRSHEGAERAYADVLGASGDAPWVHEIAFVEHHRHDRIVVRGTFAGRYVDLDEQGDLIGKRTAEGALTGAVIGVFFGPPGLAVGLVAGGTAGGSQRVRTRPSPSRRVHRRRACRGPREIVGGALAGQSGARGRDGRRVRGPSVAGWCVITCRRRRRRRLRVPSPGDRAPPRRPASNTARRTINQEVRAFTPPQSFETPCSPELCGHRQIPPPRS